MFLNEQYFAVIALENELSVLLTVSVGKLDSIQSCDVLFLFDLNLLLLHLHLSAVLLTSAVISLATSKNIHGQNHGGSLIDCC